MPQDSLVESIYQIFSPAGLLSRTLKGYEERAQQREMAVSIAQTYLERRVALIEAGTGTGKSLAYLLPAVLSAIQHQETTVISTHTIALQEQLMAKEIPFLQDKLGFSFKAVLVKGASNYLCLKNYEEFPDKTEVLNRWVSQTKEGSRSSLPFPVSPTHWEKLGVDTIRCTGSKCSFFKQCFFFKARRRIEEARILIVNHHLLLNDLGKEEKILPKFDRLVIDEAHHLEEVALNVLSKKIDRKSLHEWLLEPVELSAELPFSIRTSFEISIPAEKAVALALAEEAFMTLAIHIPSTPPIQRVKTPFPEQVKTAFSKLCAALDQLSNTFRRLTLELEERNEGERAVFEMQAEKRKLDDWISLLRSFFADKKELSGVQWIERSLMNLTLTETDLDVSGYLSRILFDKVGTISLCSATLAAGRSFSFIKQSLGIEKREEKPVEKIFDSPFDYAQSVKLAVPTDLPLPHEPSFILKASECIAKAVKITRGRTFVLFTSYEMLGQCHALLKDQFPILKQGEMGRGQILDRFKRQEGTVVFGTDSFWEGVDVPGEALELVILAKLPFKAPDDPLVEAKSEKLKESGKEPFTTFLLPEAAIKFKQGFGRLKRSKTDRGYVLCLDKRLVTKAYGRFFLETLPAAERQFAPSSEIFTEMQRFFG